MLNLYQFLIQFFFNEISINYKFIQFFCETNLWNSYFLLFHKTILYPACKSGNIGLVKNIISLNKIDIALITVLFN